MADLVRRMTLAATIALLVGRYAMAKDLSFDGGNGGCQRYFGPAAASTT